MRTKTGAVLGFACVGFMVLAARAISESIVSDSSGTGRARVFVTGHSIGFRQGMQTRARVRSQTASRKVKESHIGSKGDKPPRQEK